MTVCTAIDHITGWMWEYFMYINFLLKVTVLQEGRDPLPRCDMCGMHMPAGRLLKHRRRACRFKNTEMRIRHRDVDVASRCLDMEFRLTGE